LKNGELLARAAASGFDALITMDSGIQYQQNLINLPCAVMQLVALSNKIEDLTPSVPALLGALKNLRRNSVTRIP